MAECQVAAAASDPPPNNSFLHSLIARLAPDIKKVAELVEEARRCNPELSPPELADYLSDRIIWTYTAQGAALALPGAIPGLGTIVQIGLETGMISADIALIIRNQAYLVFVLACCYGLMGRDILVQDTLICIGLWTNAITLTKTGVIRIGSKVVENPVPQEISC